MSICLKWRERLPKSTSLSRYFDICEPSAEAGVDSVRNSERVVPTRAGTGADDATSGPVVGDIFIVGDWVVDDYWLTGIHQSPFASRVGDLHLRALKAPGDIVATLAGAGRVTSLLH